MTRTRLRWFEAVLALTSSAWALGACVADTSELDELTQPVVYGGDDRQEYASARPALRAVADSVAVLVEQDQVTRTRSGFRLADALPLRNVFSDVPVCESEPFVTQPTPGFCTGFVVGDDLIATAGHCVTRASCGATRFAFGFRMQGRSARTELGPDDVYACAEVVGRALEARDDWAVVRVDRRIQGHPPLRLRGRGTVGDRAPLTVIGHPMGLPIKIAGGARVQDNSANAYFAANLDTYAGNSGSPVLDASTLVVEGILARGAEDFVLHRERGGRCLVSNECSNGGGCDGQFEEVTRIARILPTIERAAR